MPHDTDMLTRIDDRVNYLDHQMRRELTRDMLWVASGGSLILALCSLLVSPVNWTMLIVASTITSVSSLLVPIAIRSLKRFRHLHPDGIIQRTERPKPARPRLNFPLALLLVTVQLVLIAGIAVGFRQLDDQTADTMTFVASIGLCGLLIVCSILWIIGAVRYMLSR
jgi:hypothetical protein